MSCYFTDHWPIDTEIKKVEVNCGYTVHMLGKPFVAIHAEAWCGKCGVRYRYTENVDGALASRLIAEDQQKKAEAKKASETTQDIVEGDKK